MSTDPADTTVRPPSAYPWLAGAQPPAPAGPATPLAADTGRLAPHLFPPGATRPAVEALLGRGPVISLHDHPVRLPDPLDAETLRRHRAAGRDYLGYDGLAASGLSAVFASALAWPDLAELVRWFALLRADLGHAPAAFQAEDAARIAERDQAGRVAVVFSMEDLGSVGEDLSGIEVLYGLGVRCAGLAYNAGSALGGGLAQPTDPGLSQHGRSAIRLMNALGMLIDLSHVGDRTALEASAASRHPVVITHAGARRLWSTRRMKPDDVLRACAETGGVIGIEAAPGSTRVPGSAAHDLNAVMAHAEYCADLVGIYHVALGPDTFFGDHLGLYSASGSTPMPPPQNEAALNITHVNGMENPGEAHRNAAAWMLSRGWPEEDALKVLGGNVARIVREVLP
jgi:membrane dipeptidase